MRRADIAQEQENSKLQNQTEKKTHPNLVCRVEEKSGFYLERQKKVGTPEDSLLPVT